MKHPVPKQKQSKSRSNRRYKTFQNLARLKLRRMAQLVPCSSCKALKISHCVCPACGSYAGKDILGKVKKVEATTIKVE